MTRPQIKRKFAAIINDGDNSTAGQWVVVNLENGKEYTRNLPMGEKEAKAYRDYLNMLWD